ncbi:MAG: hypothetical protein LUG95_01780 [Clostridiales bacterium]|nr:hypothetical protein [Clostridiales bacterium]
MSLKSTRKILSVIFIIIIISAVGICISVASLILRVTFCTEYYVQRFFASDEIIKQCKENFNARIEVLEAQSSIPARAFEAVESFDEIISDSAISRLFGGHNTTLYTKDTVEKFEQLCIKYLDGNSIEYDETLVHNTADKVAQIYADCFGLENTTELTNFISDIETDYQNWLSVGLLLILLPIVRL